MKLQYEYTTHCEFTPSIGEHNILLRCLPKREAFQQVCAESFSITEGFWHNESTDGQGNRIISGGTRERHRQLHYSSKGIVDMEVYYIADNAPHPMYSLPSCLTMPICEMKTLLPVLTGQFLADCLDIMHRVHQHIDYSPGTTHILTTAAEAYRYRRGVCQDYAHLMIALCRNAGMPARYACGFMMGEGQTHAWVEVNDGQCWYAFDPTNDTAIATGYVKIAHGRDAMDCSVSRGVYIGISNQSSEISVTVKEIRVL